MIGVRSCHGMLDVGRPSPQGRGRVGPAACRVDVVAGRFCGTVVGLLCEGEAGSGAGDEVVLVDGACPEADATRSGGTGPSG